MARGISRIIAGLLMIFVLGIVFGLMLFVTVALIRLLIWVCGG